MNVTVTTVTTVTRPSAGACGGVARGPIFDRGVLIVDEEQ